MPAAPIRCHVQRARRTSRIEARDGHRAPVMRAALIATSRPTSSAAAVPTRAKYPAATLSGSRKRTSATSVAIRAATSMASPTAGGAATSPPPRRQRRAEERRKTVPSPVDGPRSVARRRRRAVACQNRWARDATYTVLPGSTRLRDAECMTREQGVEPDSRTCSAGSARAQRRLTSARYDPPHAPLRDGRGDEDDDRLRGRVVRRLPGDRDRPDRVSRSSARSVRSGRTKRTASTAATDG